MLRVRVRKRFVALLRLKRLLERVYGLRTLLRARRVRSFCSPLRLILRALRPRLTPLRKCLICRKMSPLRIRIVALVFPFRCLFVVVIPLSLLRFMVLLRVTHVAIRKLISPTMLMLPVEMWRVSLLIRTLILRRLICCV